MTRKSQPLECTLCGMPMWNDENARWSPEPDREPFCSDECMALANAEYAWNRQPERGADADGAFVSAADDECPKCEAGETH